MTWYPPHVVCRDVVVRRLEMSWRFNKNEIRLKTEGPKLMAAGVREKQQYGVERNLKGERSF